MSGYDDSGFTLSRLLKWLVIGLIAIIALRLGFVALGMLLQFGLYALVKVGPILLIGWLVLKVLRYMTRDRSAAPM